MVHPLLSSLVSDLTLEYLDDFTLGRNVATVAQDVREIVDFGSKTGLILNTANCELVGHSHLVVADPFLRSFTCVVGDAC